MGVIFSILFESDLSMFKLESGNDIFLLLKRYVLKREMIGFEIRKDTSGMARAEYP